MLLIAVLLFSSAVLSYAQPDRDDQTVTKAFPSNIQCRRNAGQRRSEVAELNRQLSERGITARSTLLVIPQCSLVFINDIHMII